MRWSNAHIKGNSLSWGTKDGVQHGECNIKVPLGAAVQCVVTYAGVAQHYYWLVDLLRLPNPQRTAFEAFDRELKLLRSIFEKAEGRGYQARDLEAAVAWLLWMHQAFVVHVGGAQGAQVPGADIIAMTPQSGHFVVIGCTTKHLGSDKKLPDLVLLVLTRENIDNLLEGSIAMPNAERLYEEGTAAVRAAHERLSTEPGLPLGKT